MDTVEMIDLAEVEFDKWMTTFPEANPYEYHYYHDLMLAKSMRDLRETVEANTEIAEKLLKRSRGSRG